MEKIPVNREQNREEVGSKFNEMDYSDFVRFLRDKIRENENARFSIEVDWAGVEKARALKALLDQHSSRLHIDSATIRATPEQYEEDVNVFESGVKWEKI
ncbi:MAG: hypothetical protein PHZ25_02405 [Candidatus Pacebacteria bacterium]|jgi:hypothetical protein|nr:hypothetical protein [Candidatus Paceibacterota bacterium]